MHLKLDREHKTIIAYRNDSNVRWIYNIKSFLGEYNSDLLQVLQEYWEYKTQYHDKNSDGSVQLDFNI